MTRKAWEFTWEEICGIGANPKDQAVIDFRGYLIVSRDRRLTGSHVGRAKELYNESLEYALSKGIKVEDHVLMAAGLLIAGSEELGSNMDGYGKKNHGGSKSLSEAEESLFTFS